MVMDQFGDESNQTHDEFIYKHIFSLYVFVVVVAVFSIFLLFFTLFKEMK